MQGPSQVFLQLFYLKCRGWKYDEQKHAIDACYWGEAERFFFGTAKKKIRNRQKKSEKYKYINLWDAMRLFFCNSCNWTRQLQLDKTAATGGSSFATAATVCNFFCFDWLTEALIKEMCDKLSSSSQSETPVENSVWKKTASQKRVGCWLIITASSCSCCKAKVAYSDWY